ncbi:hypothetical protein ACXYL9_07280 [Qipengyuania sp. CAU 1752]
MAPGTPSKTALLTLDAAVDSVVSGRRLVGGTSVLERQVDAALALGCRSIWLFTAQQDDLAIAAQRLAEKGGARFRLIQRGRQLLGGLRQDDQLLVLAEGLLIADPSGLDLLSDGPVVLRLPAEQGEPAGFERLDRDHCWAGAMVLPGRVLEGLDALGEDIAPASALLRAARIARVREVALPEPWLAQDRWSLHSVNPPQLAQTPKDGEHDSGAIRQPADKLRHWLVDRPEIVLAGGVAGVLLALSASVSLYFDRPALALALVALASILARAWFSLQQLRNPLVYSVTASRWSNSLKLLPLEVLGVVGLGFGLVSETTWQSSIYVAVVAWASWLVASREPGRSGRVFADRWPFWLGCAIAGTAEQWMAGPALLTALALGVIVLNMRNRSAITHV